MNTAQYSTVIWLAAGLFLGLAFVHALLWWLGIFGVWLVVLAVTRAANLRQVVCGTLLAGFVYYGLVMVWLWNLYPITEFTITPGYQLLAIGVGWLLTVLSLALGKLVLTVPIYHFKLTKNILVVAGLWVLSDVMGAFFYCLMSFGSGAILNARFSFGWVGYLLAEHTLLLPLAAIGGVFILSFVFVTISLTIGWLWGYKKYRAGALVLLLVFVASAWTPVSPPVYDDAVAVAAIETQFLSHHSDSQSAAARRQVLMSAVEAAVVDGNQYVILPEGSGFNRLFQSDAEVLAYLDLLSPGDVVLVDSSWFRSSSSQAFFRAFIYDTKTMQVYELDKQYLVPQGEFMSYLFGTVMRLAGLETEADTLNNFYRGEPGEKVWQTNWPAHLPGVLFCFESVDPFGVRRAAHGDSVPLVAHIVSHAWFHEPHILWHQLDQMLRVNTRFANVPLYQAANLYEAKEY